MDATRSCEQALRERLARSLEENVRALHRFADAQGCAVAEFGPADIGGAKVDPFFNVNAPADLERARALFVAETARG